MNYLEFLNTLLSVAKDAYLNNCSKSTHYAQNYLLNCFIVCLLYYSLEILPTKPQVSLKSGFHLRSHKYGSRPLFKQWDTHFLGAYETQYSVFEL